MIWHKHHIIPRHAGGTDDKDNIIKCNIAMHAFLHELRFKETGDEFDRIAAMSLRNQISKSEILSQSVKAGLDKWRKENPKVAKDGLRKAQLNSREHTLTNPEAVKHRYDNIRKSMGIPVIIDGIEYGSIRQAADETGISRSKLRRIIDEERNNRNNDKSPSTYVISRSGLEP